MNPDRLRQLVLTDLAAEIRQEAIAANDACFAVDSFALATVTLFNEIHVHGTQRVGRAADYADRLRELAKRIDALSGVTRQTDRQQPWGAIKP